MMVCLNSLLQCSNDTISDLRLLLLTHKLIMTVDPLSDLEDIKGESVSGLSCPVFRFVNDRRMRI